MTDYDGGTCPDCGNSHESDAASIEGQHPMCQHPWHNVLGGGTGRTAPTCWSCEDSKTVGLGEHERPCPVCTAARARQEDA